MEAVSRLLCLICVRFAWRRRLLPPLRPLSPPSPVWLITAWLLPCLACRLKKARGDDPLDFIDKAKQGQGEGGYDYV